MEQEEYLVISKNILAIILIVILSFGAGLFALNQLINFKDKVNLLLTPCQLCEKLLKEQTLIYGELNITNTTPVQNYYLFGTNISPKEVYLPK